MKKVILCAIIALAATACASQKPKTTSRVSRADPCLAAKPVEIPAGTISIAATPFAVFRAFSHEGRIVVYSRHIDEEQRAWLIVEGYEVPGTRDDCKKWVKLEPVPSQELSKAKAALRKLTGHPVY